MFVRGVRHLSKVRGVGVGGAGVKGKAKGGTKSQLPVDATPFSAGKFSNLKKLSLEERKKTTLINNNLGFDSLKVFPSVRAAMVQEIRSQYRITDGRTRDEIEINPTPVQAAAFRKLTKSRMARLKQEARLAIKRGEQKDEIIPESAILNEEKKLKIFTLAAETGSGKTWAYLGPILSHLKEEELEAFRKSPESYKALKQYRGVRAVIMLPTSELVEQVYQSLKRANEVLIGPYMKTKMLEKDRIAAEFMKLPEQGSALNLNILKWGSGDHHDKLFEAGKMPGGIDILITMPGKMATLSKVRNVEYPWSMFQRVRYVVMDEADTLMDRSWIDDTMYCVEKFPNCSDLIFASATIPEVFNKTLKKIFPNEKDIIQVFTPQLHKISKNISLQILDAQPSPFNGSKVRCLAQALYAIHKDDTEAGFLKRIVVFVNEKKDVVPLGNTLVSKYGQNPEDIVCVTGDDSPKERMAKIEPFLKPSESLDKPRIKVLITSDLLSRGMNFVGVKNIILMDLPNKSTDLVHRIGRTGRMRQKGRVFIIIDKKTSKSWVKGLPKIVKKGVPIG